MGNSEQGFLEGVDSGAIILIFWWGPGKIGFVFQGVFEGCRFWDETRAKPGAVKTLALFVKLTLSVWRRDCMSHKPLRLK